VLKKGDLKRAFGLKRGRPKGGEGQVKGRDFGASPGNKIEVIKVLKVPWNSAVTLKPSSGLTEREGFKRLE